MARHGEVTVTTWRDAMAQVGARIVAMESEHGDTADQAQEQTTGSTSGGTRHDPSGGAHDPGDSR